ncbi:MAG: tRNA guanosine(34) transglycosylase Tgt [Myxococcota bacterium]
MDPLSRVERPRFELRARDGEARSGRLATPHGVLETPAFFPVATFGAVRGLTPDELARVGVQGLLANTYHLHLRPGEELVALHGGLHRFVGWDGPMLTDSGGFQVFSLDAFCRRSEAGVEFKSPLDGRAVFLSPERAVEIQARLGADLIVVLDEFEEIAADRAPDLARTRASLERTLRWAERGQAVHRRADQLLFGIVQGGGSAELRAESAARTAALGFAAFAVGGLGVGESPDERARLVGAALQPLPPAAPRYLMGLGLPEDLVAGVARGVDLFDCVVPTRHGRHGSVFTSRGRLNLRNARHRDERIPLDADCLCPVCARWTRAYLRHLLSAGDALAARLLSLHNLAYYMNLLRELREAIERGTLAAYQDRWRARYAEEGTADSSSRSAAHSPA